ncbi:MAG: zinc metallopeptidase [Candidatus Omnitrophica bacterium]|nr:zinc metallopeptidase [Candidatus Omnitrophota bacterium]
MTEFYFLSTAAFIGLILWGLAAQKHVASVYQKYSTMKLKKGVTGTAVAKAMLQDAGVEGITFEDARGTLADHYDPRARVIRLSKDVAKGTSIAAVGIAAHEAAHAIQDEAGYAPAQFRDRMAPVMQKATVVVLPLLILGLLLGGIIGSTFFVDLAVLIFLGIALFYVVTLPVEYNATGRAILYIREHKIADPAELEGVRTVLRAAGLTYVIAAALAITQFLRILTFYARR